MSRSSRHPALRYGVSVLAVAAAAALLTVPGIGQTPNIPVLVFDAAILVAAWYGGLGPGLLATALIALLTLSGPASAWRLVRLALFVAGGATISLLIESLHAARRRAEAANRAKDHFLAVLSHELRTPLTPVLVDVTGDARRPGDARRRSGPLLEMIRRNVELEARLIDDLLDVTRIAPGQAAAGAARSSTRTPWSTGPWRSAAPRSAAGGLRLELDLAAAGAPRRGRPGAAAAGLLEPDQERREVHPGRRDG